MKKRTTLAIIFLLIGSLILRLLIIQFDCFLHPWDEQFHALVAKNMSQDPFSPFLYKEAILDYDPYNWTENSVWLHKQPFFLWQIALSIKIFGSSVLAVRLPSLFMSLLLIPLIYRMGKLIFNKDVAFLACLIYATNNYLLDFITGYYHTDHNDVAFIFYVALSFWAYTEYIYSNNKKYIYLIGLFAGIAILNKWLVGLLVFSGWGISLFFIQESENILKELKAIIISFLICLATFIPWQIYLYINFKEEYVYETSKSSNHFFNVVEGHSGGGWYYFSTSIEQYGVVLVYFIPLALFLFYKKVENKRIKISFVVYVVITLLFFTVAKTKMPAFCLIISPIIFIGIGIFLNNSLNYISKNFNTNKISFLMLILIVFLNINIEKIQEHHTEQGKGKEGWYRKEKTKGKELAILLKQKFKNEKVVIFNCDVEEYIQIMFFTNCLAYVRIPSKNEIIETQKKGYNVVVIKKHSPLPSYINQDQDIIVLPDVDVFI